MKFCSITLLALGVTGCSARGLSDPSGIDLGASSFPVGTYTNCAQGLRNPDGNTFLNGAGFQSGAILTLGQSGSNVMATYVDQNGATQSLGFSTTTSTSATLAQPGRVMAGFSSLCVMGPGIEKAYPASMTVTAGTLSYTAGMAIVTLTGGLQSDAGMCGTLTAPKASFWILCEDRQGGALTVDTGAPAVTQLPVGQYSCSTQVETYDQVNGINQYVAGGASGTLTLTQNGAQVTAQYSGDPSLAGTLRLATTSSTTASVAAGQTLMAPCMVPVATGIMPPQTPEPLPIAAGSLSIVGSTLFLSFAGSTGAGSSCPGAQVAGSVICSK
jgi:hypothetical protein